MDLLHQSRGVGEIFAIQKTFYHPSDDTSASLRKWGTSLILSPNQEVDKFSGVSSERLKNLARCYPRTCVICNETWVLTARTMLNWFHVQKFLVSCESNIGLWTQTFAQEWSVDVFVSAWQHCFLQFVRSMERAGKNMNKARLKQTLEVVLRLQDQAMRKNKRHQRNQNLERFKFWLGLPNTYYSDNEDLDWPRE